MRVVHQRAIARYLNRHGLFYPSADAKSEKARYISTLPQAIRRMIYTLEKQQFSLRIENASTHTDP